MKESVLLKELNCVQCGQNNRVAHGGWRWGVKGTSSVRKQDYRTDDGNDITCCQGNKEEKD